MVRNGGLQSKRRSFASCEKAAEAHWCYIGSHSKPIENTEGSAKVHEILLKEKGRKKEKANIYPLTIARKERTARPAANAAKLIETFVADE